MGGGSFFLATPCTVCTTNRGKSRALNTKFWEAESAGLWGEGSRKAWETKSG